MLQYIRRLKITPGGSEKQTETKKTKNYIQSILFYS